MLPAAQRCCCRLPLLHTNAAAGSAAPITLALRSYMFASRSPMMRCFRQDTSPATSADAMRCFTILARRRTLPRLLRPAQAKLNVSNSQGLHATR